MTTFPQIVPGNLFDERLLANVRPGDWKAPEPAGRYNLVVIGAGTAGLVTAAGAAGLGARVALVERGLMGGDCLNVGCVPSKGLLRAARAIAGVRGAAEFGVRGAEGATIDFAAAMDRMRRLRSEISRVDSAERFTGLGVDVFFGDARFVDGETVKVGGQRLRFRRAVVATGARAVLPPVPGLADAEPLTNETVFSLTSLPPRLAVIGAGPIGCELSQAFARFGSRVSLVEQADQVLTREDPDAARIVSRALEESGVELVLGAGIDRVETLGGERTLFGQRGGAPLELSVDAILVGAGRAPNVDDLGLDAVGVAWDARTGVTVDDRLRTTNPRIFAAGDVCTPWKFTHHSDFQARIVIQNALFHGRKKASALRIPWCTYTDPEIAHVGLYEHEARERGLDVDAFVQDFAEVDRAILEGDTEGFVKVIVPKGKDRILGATLVGRHAGEMISELTLAMDAGVGLGRLASVIHPYPTEAEAIRKLGDAWNRTRLTPTVQRIFETWLRWTR